MLLVPNEIEWVVTFREDDGWLDMDQEPSDSTLSFYSQAEAMRFAEEIMDTQGSTLVGICQQVSYDITHD